ncbi:MAG: pectinesterase family protein [Defluviitaleaceae bacterium]|nr:pectinesterase family protein [Defluviitaleaceae bacterium]
MKKSVIVAKNGGDFATVQAAVDFLGESGGKIFVKSGIYREKLSVLWDGVSLVGADAMNTVVCYDDFARKMHEDGTEYGTFRSQTVYVAGNNFYAENITFENSAGKGADVGQAVAFYGDGDKHSFFGCVFRAHQDTLFMSPHPPKPLIAGAFDKLPTKNRKNPTAVHRSYFENCTIQGDVDFIFGGSVSYFHKCTIISNDLGQETNGYITAAATPQGFAFGYVFNECNLVSDAAENTVYLGRPWRDFAKTVFVNCYMGKHIKKAGWHDWDKSSQQAFYAEYGSFGLGVPSAENSERRVKWSKILSERELHKYTVENVFGGWLPEMIVNGENC